MGPKLEDFEVLATIGSGSHGTVRKVRRLQDNQVLVWKELNYGSMGETEKQGLVTEVNLLRELRHPNVVKFLHHVVERKTTTLYIIMDYCPGGDLKRLISKCRQTSTFLEEGFIWRVLKQVCEALKVCHSRELRGGRVILHRDIKPANVFLDAEGDVKLGDFGLARTLNSEASFATTFVGTPYYMSPEVINGQEYNEKSDMWSLGCLIYELCALHPPFQATTHKQLAAKIREARYDRIPIQYSSALQEIISLLLTYEDFLRPTALMIIHHSALVARTSTRSDDMDDDPLCQSLNPEVLLNSRNKDRMSGSAENGGEVSETKRSEVTDMSIEKSSSNEVGLKDSEGEISQRSGLNPQSAPNNGMSLSETYKISVGEDVDGDLVSKRKCVNRENLSENGSYEDISEHEKALDDSIEKICQAAKEAARPVYTIGKSPDIMKESELLKPDCACGGMSLNRWRERVLALREAEAAVRERELDVKEREREVIHREHRVATMEREARQHLVRAQIYLKQSRHRKNAATSPHRPPADMDTTVSADVGDDEVQTVAKLDPQQIENPFLRMRGVQPQPEKRVSFEGEKPAKFKSNTLDNPKSRRKRGNVFGLVDRTSENKKDPKETSSEVTESRVPLQPVSDNNQVKQDNQKLKSNNFVSREKSITPSQIALRQRRSSREDSRITSNGNVVAGLKERCRSSENLSRKPAETIRDKENAPVQEAKGKKVPEVKQNLRTWKTATKVFERPSKREAISRKGQKVPVLQFYNVV